MEKSRAIIESRVNALGASEAVVQVQGTDQILVQIPGLTNTEDALNTIGKTGKLEFARLDSFTDEDVKTKIENGQPPARAPSPTISAWPRCRRARRSTSRWRTARTRPSSPARTSRRSTSASGATPPPTTREHLARFGRRGGVRRGSKDLAPTKGKIVIILDNEVQSAPATQSEIPDGNIQITGNTRSTRPRRCRPCWKAARCP